MKKLPFYIALGVAISAISALIFVELSRNKNKITTGPDYLPLDENSAAAKTFRGFNYNLYLNPNTKHGEAEITALQTLINAYYGGTQSVPVTGVYDEATKAAVKDITGRSGTNLYQFRYFYFIQLRGDQAAIDIFDKLTNKA